MIFNLLPECKSKQKFVKVNGKWGDGPKDFMRSLFGNKERKIKPLMDPRSAPCVAVSALGGSSGRQPYASLLW